MTKMTAATRRMTLALCALALAAAAQAQTYPSKPVRWLVPSAAGGAFDILTRALAPVMSQQTGQTFFVDNRAGAAGLLGMEMGSKAPPDGYTILTAGTSQLIFNPFFHDTLPYNVLKDYAPVALLSDLPVALWVQTSVPVKSYREFIAYAKSRPGDLNYGSAGVGHVFHLGMALLDERAGIRTVHVPYKGVGPALQDFLAGRIQLMFSVAQRPVMAQWKAGKILPLAAATEARMPTLPDVPTFNELGVADMDLPNWVGLVVPSGTPREIIVRLNAEVLKAAASPVAGKTYESMAMEVARSTPEQFDAKIRREHAFWGGFIKKLGIKPE